MKHLRLQLFLLFALNAMICQANQKPNIVVIFTDDQGYGDLSCYGSQTVKTPQIDSLASDGTKFTSFYAQVVCGPSRSALLTGRYPCRSLGWSMPASEITIAELLQSAGYATGCVGKWDVSNRAAIAERMPCAKGFDFYWGPLGANDSGEITIHHNNILVETTKDMAGLTRRYTDKSIEFIKEHKDQPFFLYLAHTMLHSIVDASPEFKGKSAGGLYGDAIEELDFHTGRLLQTLDDLNLRDNTLVVFTTDNGAWNNLQDELRKRHHGQIAWGSSGPLREGKGSTYEGGIRVPCLARWPGKIPAGRVSDAIFATIDFLPTFAKISGAEVPSDRIIDGQEQLDLLTGKSVEGSRKDYFYFSMNEMHAVRKGAWKLLLPDRRQIYGYVKDKGSNEFELYNLETDIGEENNLAKQHPEIVRDLTLHATSIHWPDVIPNNTINLAQLVKQKKDQLETGDWEKQGLKLAAKAKIEKHIHIGIADKVLPGCSILVMHHGKVVLREAFGLSDIDSARTFSVDTPCRIASITKPHTATLIVMLAEKGLLSLDKPVDEYLSEFKEIQLRGGPASRAPTLRECLSHTAGFPGNDAQRGENLLESAEKTLGQAVQQVAQGGLIAEPGSAYAYSRMGYQVAGRVAEVVTGRTFQDLLRRYLLQPLGMEVATMSPSEAIQPLIATQYRRTPTGFQSRRELLVPGGNLNALMGINPGGSLVSSLDDVTRLMLLHRNRGKVEDKQIVSEKALQSMYVAAPASPGTGYGLGFNIVRKNGQGQAQAIRHTGASGTFAMLDFKRDLILVILTQVEQTQIAKWRNQLVELVIEACPPALLPNSN